MRIEVSKLIKKAVIPVAGRGTRLLPTTKEQPKEMLPIFAKSKKGQLLLKPVVQLIFEQLFDFGLRDFCFVVGREKRAIEDHFSPDYSFLDSLTGKRRNIYIRDLDEFYKRIEKSNITWINQNKPLGYGHAVSLASSFVNDERFLLHAGDTLILSPNNQHLTLCVKQDADCVIALQKVKDPKPYGIVLGKKKKGTYTITKAVEKPTKYISNLAIMPLNTFNPIIMKILKKIKKGKGNEIQITDAIQYMISENMNVLGYELPKNSIRFDIGTPENYFEAQYLSKKYSENTR
tara:strand:- start:768 stop:1637 length:870 start_codon:yes stop_codon:yes gene_type:complete